MALPTELRRPALIKVRDVSRLGASAETARLASGWFRADSREFEWVPEDGMSMRVLLMLRMLVVHQPYDPKVLRSLRLRIVVDSAALESEQAALFTHAQLLLVKVDPRDRFINCPRPLFFESLQLDFQPSNLLVQLGRLGLVRCHRG